MVGHGPYPPLGYGHPLYHGDTDNGRLCSVQQLKLDEIDLAGVIFPMTAQCGDVGCPNSLPYPLRMPSWGFPDQSLGNLTYEAVVGRF